MRELVRPVGILLFALFCLVLIVEMIFWQKQAFSEMNLNVVPPLLWLIDGIQIMCVGMGVFVAGVKGLKLFLSRQWRPLALALAIILFPFVGNMLYAFWDASVGFPIALSQLGLAIGYDLAPYLPLSALLLGLLSDEFNTHRWRMTRSLGVLLTFVPVASLAMVVIWNAVLWEASVASPPMFSGHIGVVDPTRGIWVLFGGQWIGPLLTNMLILAAALGLALLALIRSFLIQPENEQSREPLAA